TLGGGGTQTYEMIGCIIARDIALNGHFLLHFDEDLYRVGPMPPFIATNLVPQVVPLGENAVFSLAAKGPSLSYRWQGGGLDSPGATTNILTVTNVGPADAGLSSVIVTNLYGVQTSGAMLSIGSAPTILKQPVSQAVPLNSTGLLQVTAKGTAPL